MRFVVIAMLLLVIGSLGSALFFLFRDTGNSSRMLRSLAIRVGLSMTLFMLLMAGYRFGFITGKL
ncbi:twin transmembrane helix small protein [Methyloversatilis thermotolerans]|uniref:twin transmembrane helix small protein n=1 Tax=Methyloversatilis thermotolerans TaxID=1346290 RepID=UPI00036D37BF|nr:twin transmembrane helix small protein [Methyloversatilis thermotolerans]